MPAALEWLAARREASGLHLERIPLDRCTNWSVSRGELRHRSGRYFQVVGTSVVGGPYAGWHRPMIRQHEIGILGFMVAERASGLEWLVQAKTEPGNVGGTQLAPTVQATASNQDRVHGGASTRYLEWFVGPGCTMRHVVDVLASEQGTRFLGKRNRNVTIFVDGAGAPVDGEAWRWVPGPVLRELLARDFTINTDARSVLVSSPWSLLTHGAPPFARWLKGPAFERTLAPSFEASEDVGPVLAALQLRRRQALAVTSETPLGDASDTASWPDGWNIERDIAFVHVRTNDREVAEWCQPLLTQEGDQQVDLYGQSQGGVMRFLFRYVSEPGLRSLVELGPTTQSDAGVTQALPAWFSSGSTRLRARQSDEGGRFLMSTAEYRVIELPSSDTTVPSDTVWLTLSQIAALASRPATFTNEARSAISLLLSLA